MSSTKAMMNDTKPCCIDSMPSDGPTTSSCTMRVGAGILPELSVLARSFVSSIVKFPVISELPPDISPFTLGAL